MRLPCGGEAGSAERKVGVDADWVMGWEAGLGNLESDKGRGPVSGMDSGTGWSIDRSVGMQGLRASDAIRAASFRRGFLY